MIGDYKIKNLDIRDLNSDKEIITNFPNILKNIELEENRYMCFNYALKNKKLEYVEDSVEFVFKHYDMIPFREAKRGDIVLFRDDFDDTYLHFARVFKKRKAVGETIIRAKFGGLGIYEHKLDYTPSCYGDRIEFWRKK